MTERDIEHLAEVVHDAIHELAGECRGFIVLVDCPEGGCFRMVGNVNDHVAGVLLRAAERKVSAQTAVPALRGTEVTH